MDDSGVSIGSAALAEKWEGRALETPHLPQLFFFFSVCIFLKKTFKQLMIMNKLAVALLLPSVAFADQITIPDVSSGDVADPVCFADHRHL